MPNNESGTGGANDSVGGGGGGHAAMGGAGEQQPSSKALFVGFIYPSPLDAEGQLSDQPLSEGFGEPQLGVVIYGYDSSKEGASLDIHAAVDKELGQPFFKAYLYPIKTEDDSPALISFAGGGGGHAAMGGAATLQPIYLGQFFAAAPNEGNSGGGSSNAGTGNTGTGNTGTGDTGTGGAGSGNNPGAGGGSPATG